MVEQVLSVGIDIGTSTTQLVFSRLSLENTAGYFSIPSVSIVKKEVLYKSGTYLTPLQTPSLIDGEAVREMVAAEYAASGFLPNHIGTGAVIITGESARKENAALVLEKLSAFAGDFVVATAGPDLESILAAKGSGAQSYSQDNSRTVLNLDIGGGTTNIALFHCGTLLSTGCLDLGGRNVRVDDNLTVTYVSPAAALISENLRLELRLGRTTDLPALRSLCGGMNQLLEQYLGLSPVSPLLRLLQTPGSSPLQMEGAVDAIFFSGGVADGIYTAPDSPFPYGDIGALLGEAIRSGKLCSAFPLMRPRETIRATVVGAGTYATTVSGSTIYIDEGMLPMRNIPTLRLSGEIEAACFVGDPAPLTARIRWFLEQNSAQRLAMAMEGLADPTYGQICGGAAAFLEAADAVLPADAPLLLVVERDMAKALGQAVKRQDTTGRSLIVLDAIRVGDNDYLDMGSPLMDGMVIPVVVKTLVFG